jgi:carboxyl-terminal processing protease
MRWIAIVVALAVSAPARADAPWTALGDEVVDRVRKHFYDAARAEDWADHHKGYAKSVHDAAGFVAATRAALADLKASHTSYVPRSSPDYAALRSIFGDHTTTWSIGADIGDLGDGWFVRHVFAGSLAETAGLLRGDRIVSVNGKPFDPVESLRGGRLRVRVERDKGKPPLELVVPSQVIEPRVEWLHAQKTGTRVVTRNGKRIGYQHLFSCAGEDHADVLADAIAGPLADADALVLDFRDGWGGCQPSFVALFDTGVPAMTLTSRGDKKLALRTWRKPLVVLVNGRTRSGKEVVSQALRVHHRATIVGERTAGAVLAGSLYPLSNGDALFLAVSDVDVDGVRLEGVGVPVDVEVKDDVRFAAGKDPQLERALDIAATK